jgi:hypothetical protein
LFESTVSADGTMLLASYKQPTESKAPLFRVAAGPAGSHALSGTWSRQNSQQNLPSWTITFKSLSDGLMFTMFLPMSSMGMSYSAKFDGKDYPVEGDAAGSTVSLKKVNDRSIEETIRQDGKIATVWHMTVSEDGKTITLKIEEQGRSTALTGIRTVAALNAVTDNPFVGIWKMNVEKSKHSGPAPKSSTVQFMGIENGTVFVQETVDSQGKIQQLMASEPWDGKEGATVFPGETARCSRIDSNTVVLVFKKDGKETRRITEAISNGGKTLTRTVKEAQENEPGIIAVFEKQ